MKICIKCGEEKPLTDFYKSKQNKDGYVGMCKSCHSEKTRRYYMSHKDSMKVKMAEYRRNNRETILAKKKEYYQKNKSSHYERVKIFEKNNPEKVAEYRRISRKRNREHNKNNLKWRLSQRMGTALWKSLAMKGGRSWKKLVGYTVDDLAKHLKRTMPEGFTWEDFLNGDLHIDHKIPNAVFNYETPEDIDFAKCWCLSNLQLLPAHENRVKNAKIDSPFQPSLAFGGSL